MSWHYAFSIAFKSVAVVIFHASQIHIVLLLRLLGFFIGFVVVVVVWFYRSCNSHIPKCMIRAEEIVVDKKQNTAQQQRTHTHTKKIKHQFFNCVFTVTTKLHCTHLLIYIKCLFVFLFAKLIINQQSPFFSRLILTAAQRKLTPDYATNIIST